MLCKWPSQVINTLNNSSLLVSAVITWRPHLLKFCFEKVYAQRHTHYTQFLVSFQLYKRLVSFQCWVNVIFIKVQTLVHTPQEQIFFALLPCIRRVKFFLVKNSWEGPISLSFLVCKNHVHFQFLTQLMMFLF